MKVAVVGSGVSGVAATWLLNEHSEHEVHLFEKGSVPGGHANTARFSQSRLANSKNGVDVDTAFIAFNDITYPNFVRFLSQYPHLELVAAPMSFSLSRDDGVFEWSSQGLSNLFTQPLRILDSSMWRFLYDIFRFNACGQSLASNWERACELDPELSKLSVGQYIAREGYSDSFRDNYLIPLTAGIWSIPPDQFANDFPLQTCLVFMKNHRMLQMGGRPTWWSFRNGSRTYINEIIKQLQPTQLHLETPVVAVDTSSGLFIELADGRREHFDHVVLACHSDDALKLLKAGGGATPEEEDILGSIRWVKNDIVLHSDTKLMPKSSRAWAAWNYLTYSGVDAQGKRKANSDFVSVTFNMNKIHNIPRAEHGNILVSENPPFPPDPNTVVGSWEFYHPVLDGSSPPAQRRIPSIQGKRGISFAGAYQNCGFHEDGFTSGLLAVLQSIPNGIRMPFDIVLMDGSHWGPLQQVPFKVRRVETNNELVHILAMAFSVLERLRIRAIMGCILGFLLDSSLWILALFGIRP